MIIYECYYFCFFFVYCHFLAPNTLRVTPLPCVPGSEDRAGVVGKDLYVDSTSKLECVLQEDTVPLKGGSGPSATPSPSLSASNSTQEDVKQGNAEPRSEESDVAGEWPGVCGFLPMCVCW